MDNENSYWTRWYLIVLIFLLLQIIGYFIITNSYK